MSFVEAYERDRFERESGEVIESSVAAIVSIYPNIEDDLIEKIAELRSVDPDSSIKVDAVPDIDGLALGILTTAHEAVLFANRQLADQASSNRVQDYIAKSLLDSGNTPGLHRHIRRR